MATASPALSNSASDSSRPATSTATAAVSSLLRPDTTPKTLRGLNKPKCIQCGNVARSRCPYQSCKNCCARAQNPCHIHVLKAAAPEKTPAPTTPVPEKPAADVSPVPSSLRIASLRQLSNTFSQFNNLVTPRSKKPLTKKEAAAINKWRFQKLKEYSDRNIDAENEAFDRYMQNVSLLEEVFSMKSLLASSSGDTTLSADDSNKTSTEDDTEKLIQGQKLRLRSNPVRTENVRNRLQQIIDEGLKKLQEHEVDDDVDDVDDVDENDRSKRAKTWEDRTSALCDLIDKLNKSRNEEDLQSCLEMKARLYTKKRSTQTEPKNEELPNDHSSNDGLVPKKELGQSAIKFCIVSEIDQEVLTRIDAHFSSLEKIEDL